MAHPLFQYRLLIKEADLDTFGHVNNAAYLRLLEEARWDLITRKGFGVEQIRLSGLGPIILDIHIRFLKELRLRQEINITTQLTSYRGKIGTLHHQIVTPENGNICCDANYLFGLFDVHQRKLILPTPEWMAALCESA